MRARPRPHPASRAAVLALASLLVAGLLSVGPARAHTFTKTDGNDVPGKLDIAASTVSHTSSSIVFKIRTYQTWTPASLQNDSFLLVQIDKNNDRRYERCAVIFFASRLRSVLTNCGQNIIQNLPVGKPNGSTVRTTIPKSQTGLVHWWATATYWEGAAPCRNGCVDFLPNRFPDILHDLVPPTVNLGNTPLRIWVNSTSLTFTFPFSVSDQHTGVKSWKVQRRAYEQSSWTTVASGTGGGSKSPSILAVPGHSVYRVVATDRHGNVKTDTRKVFAPRDDDELAPQGVYVDATPTPTSDATAFGGDYTTLGMGESLTYNYAHTTGPCRPFELIGPGGGDWTVEVTVTDVLEPIVIDGTATPAGPRQVLFTHSICDTTSFVFTVTEAGVEFPVDGVVAKAS